MFCPSCHSEYRPGIARCATCDVALVEEIDPAEAGSTGADDGAAVPEAELRVSYCGFLSLEDARQARDLLRRERIRSEIAILEPTHADLSHPVREEYWLRIAPRDFSAAAGLLGYDSASEETSGNDETFCCSACGHSVRAEESFCPRCGERFEDL